MPAEKWNRKNIAIKQSEERQTGTIQQVQSTRANIFSLETDQIGTNVQNRKHKNQD